MLNRRHFLYAGLFSGFAAMIAGRFGFAHAETGKTYEVAHSEEEWHKILSPDQYTILRQEGTERPFTSALLHETRTGDFTCAGCGLPLFSSKTKYDSGTGWPSFWAPLDNAVSETQDRSFGMARTAVSCRRCGGHLGHVFDDGPKPTGLRYCMNGVAMKFVASAA